MGKLLVVLGLLGVLSGNGIGQESQPYSGRNDLLRTFSGTIIKNLKQGCLCYRVEPHHTYLPNGSIKEAFWEVIEGPGGVTYIDTNGDGKVDRIGGFSADGRRKGIKRELLSEDEAMEFDEGFKIAYESLFVDSFLYSKSAESRPKG